MTVQTKLQTFSETFPASPLVKIQENLQMNRCENTAGDYPGDSLWVIGCVDFKHAMDAKKRKKEHKYVRIHVVNTKAVDNLERQCHSRAFGDTGQSPVLTCCKLKHVISATEILHPASACASQAPLLLWMFRRSFCSWINASNLLLSTSCCVLHSWKTNSGQSPDPIVQTFSGLHVRKQRDTTLFSLGSCFLPGLIGSIVDWNHSLFYIHSFQFEYATQYIERNPDQFLP